MIKYYLKLLKYNEYPACTKNVTVSYLYYKYVTLGLGDIFMRIVIESNDRIGISQEILAVFAKQAWNLKAVEIISCFTYVHVEFDELTLIEIKRCLANVDGVIEVQLISLLPSEQREQHLQALLDKMPEPCEPVEATTFSPCSFVDKIPR